MHGILATAMVLGLVSGGMAGDSAAIGGDDTGTITAAVSSQEERVDINKGDKKALETVPGIGPTMADRIIAWREANGPFERIDDLLNVRGIGATTLEKLRPYLVVGEEGDEGRR